MSVPSDPWNPSPTRLLMWTVTTFAVLSIVIFSLNAAGLIGGTAVDRVVIEQSRQYAETNTEAFYVRLETLARVEVQLADPATPEPVRVGLASQKTLLESELRREVARIPADARTADMARYGGGL